MDILAGARFIVLRDFLGLGEFLHLFIGVTAEITHCNLGFFTQVTNNLRELTATFFGKRRQRHANEHAGGGRIQTQVRRANSLFNRGHHVLFPGLNRERAGIGHTHLSDLIDRGHRAVVVHHHVVEQTGRGAARANLNKVFAQGLDRAVHLVFGLFLNFTD